MTTSKHYQQIDLFAMELDCPTSSPGDIRVSPFHSLAQERAQRMTAISGRKCCALLTKSDPLGLLVKTLLGSHRWCSVMNLEWKVEQLPETKLSTSMKSYIFDKRTCCSTTSANNSKESVIRSNRLLFRLVPSMPRTDAIEYGLWHTPRANDAEKRGNFDATNPRNGLAGQARIYPTIRASDADKGGRGDLIQAVRGNQNKHFKLWPTPRTGDGMAGALRHPENIKDHKSRLEDVVAMLPTPSAGDYRSDKGFDPNSRTNSPQLRHLANGRLNPDWIEWLMGYPMGWTDVPLTEPEPIESKDSGTP